MTTPIYPDLIPEHQTAMPDPSSDTTFGARMKSLFDWFVGVFTPSANLMAQQAYQNAMAAAEAAESAQTVAGVSMWAAGTNYATGAPAISPSNYQTYRRLSPGGVNATDPALSALWEEVGATRVKKSGDTMSGDLKFADDKTIGKDEIRLAPQYKRPMFKTTFANSATWVGAVPSGTGGSSGFWANNGTLNEFTSFGMDGTGGVIEVGKDATGGTVYRPFKIRTGGADRFQVDAAGQVIFYGSNMLVGASSFPANVASGMYVVNGVSAGGFRCHQGTTGAFSADAYNLYWTGSAMQAWVGAVNLGNFTISSDYRIKDDVQDLKFGGIETVMRLRPVSYRLKDYGPFKADGRLRVGFIAHEVQEVIESAADGEKDDTDQIQSLRLDPIVAELTLAVQQLVMENRALRDRVAALEASK